MARGHELQSGSLTSKDLLGGLLLRVDTVECDPPVNGFDTMSPAA
jgi:hypothetical protein